MTLAAEPEVGTPIALREPKSSAVVRLVAAVGGLVVLACAALASFGTVVIVLIGMAVVGGVQRKRGRALTRSGHWVAACSTMAVILLALKAAANAKPSPAMVWLTMILGVGMAVTFFSTLLGTLSWGAGMLLGLALVGRWPGVQGEGFEDLAVDLPAAASTA